MSQKEDIIEFSCIVSCLCPISFSKVIHPVRGQHCNHMRFFDQSSFIELCGNKKSGSCPLCMKPISINELVWDEYIQIQLNLASPDAENIVVKQDLLVPQDYYSEHVETKDIVDLSKGCENDSYTRQESSHFYKTEDDRYIPVPSSSFSFADYLFLHGIESEQHARKQRSLEAQYWKYMEFYTTVLSKAIHLLCTKVTKNPFVIFVKPSIQQISTLQEVVDTVDAYSLVVNGDVFVVIDEEYYPTEEEENKLIHMSLSIDEFVTSKSL